MGQTENGRVAYWREEEINLEQPDGAVGKEGGYKVEDRRWDGVD